MSEKEIRSCWPEWQLQQRLFTGEFCTSYLAVRMEGEQPVSKMIQVVKLPPDNPELADKQQQAVAELAKAGISGEVLIEYFARLRRTLEGELRQFGSMNAAGFAPVERIEFAESPSGGWTCWILTDLNMPISYYEGKHITGAAEALRCGLDLCSALVRLEDVGGVHGEISHTTVVRDNAGSFRMTCYALRRVLEKTGQVFFPLRSSDFDAPEVRTGRKFSISADLYSVGVVMGYLLCGGEMPDEEHLSQVSIQYRRLAAIIRKAMSPRVQDRYITAAEMLSVLREPGLAGADESRFTEPTQGTAGGYAGDIGADHMIAPNLPKEEPQGFWGKVMAFLAPIEGEDPEESADEDLLSYEEEDIPVFGEAPSYPAEQNDMPLQNAGVDAWAESWNAGEAQEVSQFPQAAAEAPMPLADAAPMQTVYVQEVQSAPEYVAAPPTPAADIPSDAETEQDIGRMVTSILEENAAPAVMEEIPEVPEYVPAAEPVFVPEEAPAAEPVYAPVQEPVYVPAAEPVYAPVQEPAYAPAAEPVYAPAEPAPAQEEGNIDSLLSRGSVFDDAELQQIIQDTRTPDAAPVYAAPEMPEGEVYPEYEEEAPKEKKFPVWIVAVVAGVLLAALAIVLLKPWQYIGAKDDASDDAPAVSDAANVQDDAQQKDDDQAEAEPEGFFYLPNSDKQPVTQAELAELDRYESYMALNEIYARHGMIFQTPSLQEYFESQAWYTGTTESSIEAYNAMSDVEKDNINAITEYQIQMGYTESQ